MGRARAIAGYVAIVGLAVALNVLLLKEDPFLPSVLISMIVGTVSGLLWLVITLWTMAWGARTAVVSATGLNTVFRAVLFLGICVVLYAFAKHWDYSWDLTREGRRELAEQTVKVLAGLNRDVSVTALFSTVGDPERERVRDKTRRFLEQCQKHSAHLKVEFVDPELEPTIKTTLKLETVSAQGTVVIRCGARQKVLHLSGTTPRLEERDFTNGLINVVRSSRPKIYFLTGHRERDMQSADASNGGSQFRVMLEGEGYATASLSISVLDPKVPADCDILAINGPDSDLHPREIEGIREYMERGGRMLVLIDPKVALTDEAPSELLCTWLKQRYGLEVGNDVIVSRMSQRPGEVHLLPESSTLSLYSDDPDPKKQFKGCFEKNHPITRGFQEEMVLSAARTVAKGSKLPEKVSCAVLLRTLPETWAETNLRQLRERKPVRPDPGEAEGSLGVAAAVSAKTDIPVGDTGQTRDARLLVVGDSDFAKNGQIIIAGHANFLLNAMAWLSENEELIAIRPTGSEDPAIILSEGQEQAIAWISTLGVMQTILLCGWIAYLRRRKYQ